MLLVILMIVQYKGLVLHSINMSHFITYCPNVSFLCTSHMCPKQYTTGLADGFYLCAMMVLGVTFIEHMVYRMRYPMTYTMEKEEEDQFLAYIVKEHDAVSYARGTLVIVEKNQQYIEFAVVDRDDEEAIVCSAELTRDMDDKPIALTEFEKTLVKKNSIVFGKLFEPVSLSEAKIEDFESLWDEMKPKILHRSMGI